MSRQSPVLVVGATGLLGFEITRLLRPSSQSLRALVRPSTAPEKRQALEQLGGVELVEGDLKDPSSLERACRGVGTIVSTASAMGSRQPGDSLESVDERGHLNLIAAAERVGVERFVFVSFAPFPTIDFAIQRAKRSVEAGLAGSSLQYTVLQPSYFSEAWLGPALGFDLVGGKAKIFGKGTSRVSWISYRDVARFAVWACERPEEARDILPIGGPDPLSQLEVVGIFEELGAQKPDLDFIPETALEAQLQNATNPIEEAIAGFMLGVARGHTVDIKTQLELLPGRLGTVREHARAVLSQSKEKGNE